MPSKIKALIESADSLIIAAGAGMSVDSGLPDFRGNEGLGGDLPGDHRGRLGYALPSGSARATPGRGRCRLHLVDSD